MPEKHGKKVILVCRKCGKRKGGKISSKDFKIEVSTQRQKEEIVVVDKKSRFEALPKTAAQCPKCEHPEAYWWMQQTRASDEPPTRFFKCAKCSHVWREYE